MLRSFAPAAAFALLLAGCGGSSDPDDQVPEGEPPAAELANRIEALSELKSEEKKQEEVAKQRPPRLAPLRPEHIPADFAGPSCRLQQGSNILLYAAAPGGVVNADGRPVRLHIDGPVGPSGGFFEGEGVTVSIGRRTPPAEETPGIPPPTFASATIGGDPSRPVERVSGSWACVR